MERFLAGEVTTVGQVTLELLNFLLQVDLVEEQTGHFFADFLVDGLLCVGIATRV